MAAIFLSYRRRDTGGVAGRIYDRLEAHFGRDAVFMDVDTIPDGVDFRDYINEALSQCGVVLALIGPRWAGKTGTRRRIDDPTDLVRIELEVALARKLPVIPVLVDRERPPGEADLPPSLAALAYRQARIIGHGPEFHGQVTRLIQGIEYHLKRKKATEAPGGTSVVTPSSGPATPHLDPPPQGRRGQMNVVSPPAVERLEGGSGTNLVPPNSPQAPTIAPPRLLDPPAMTMVRIEPGEFLMGSTKSQIDTLLKQFPDAKGDWLDWEQPRHSVMMTRPFYLAVHQVTVGQFRRFIEASGYKTYGDWQSPGFDQSEDHPVIKVSHDDALEFLAWLNKQEQGQSRGYRLPTEAEWEYACRAGSTGVYGQGDDPAELDRVAWFLKNSSDATNPVGRKEGNAFGLYDMLGNVWEWCDDWFAPAFYRASPKEDPRNTKGAPSRVIRGGSWRDGPRGCRPARRNGLAPGLRFNFLGFRVAADRQ
jgi:formylglycine-generating enzyme required for sulfatase activity